MRGRRYGPPVYWTRDYALGTWHPTTDYPPGAPPPPEPSIKPLAASTAEPISTEARLANGHATGTADASPAPMDTEQVAAANGGGGAAAASTSGREGSTPAAGTDSGAGDMQVCTAASHSTLQTAVVADQSTAL